MIIKIYFGSKPLFLVSDISGTLASRANDTGTVICRELSGESIKDISEKMQQLGTNAGIFVHDNPETVLEAFKRELVLIQAGGGLVCIEDRDVVLLIFRRKKWDMPKGKLDPDEKIEDCAVREVREETGLQNLDLKQLLCKTYHTYHQNGRFILKETFWFLMTSAHEQVLTPQTMEDIEKCEWVPFSKIAPYMNNTFPAIVDVVMAGRRVLDV